MAKKRRSKRGLSRIADKYAISLIFEASGGKLGTGTAPKAGEEPVENPISFRDRRALLDSVTKLLAGEPPPVDEEDESGVDVMRKRLNDDGDSGTVERGTDGSDAES